VIDLARERFTKNLWTERVRAKPQLVTVGRGRPGALSSSSRCWTTARRHDAEAAGRAVPRRRHSGPLEVELTRRNIPFVKFGGLKFLDSAHVKDMLAVLRFAQNPRDRVAGFRLLQLLPGRRAAHGRQGSLDAIAAEPEPMIALAEFEPPRAGEAGLRSSQLLEATCARTAPAGRRRSARRATGMSRIWSAFTRTPTCAQGRSAAARADRAGYAVRERFLTELTLDPPDATSDQAGVPLLDEDYLILSTIHSAKGQEWRAVLCSMSVDGCMPSIWATGTTRRDRGGAPAALCGDDAGEGQSAPDRAAALLHHGQHGQGDRHVYASRTRFIPVNAAAVWYL
jgi:DNA helicase-2/ATP-dependent DNA helicase PcrA